MGAWTFGYTPEQIEAGQDIEDSLHPDEINPEAYTTYCVFCDKTAEGSCKHCGAYFCADHGDDFAECCNECRDEEGR